MNKEDAIKYLRKIKNFLNLAAVCRAYNEKNPDNTIDYNNLRIVINGNSNTRLSETKLAGFIEYLHSYLYKEVFEVSGINSKIINDVVENSVNKYSMLLVDDIMEELNK